MKARGGEEASRKAHNLEAPVRFRAPQQVRQVTCHICLFCRILGKYVDVAQTVRAWHS